MSEREITLQGAVDALTKPVVTLRSTGTDHDHHWQPLLRALTPDEIAERRQTKRPIPRKVETGQWWCAWCETMVDERPEKVAGNRISRRDDPNLLEQLHTAVTSSIGGNGSGQLAHTRTPFDVGALNLYGAIDERVRAWFLMLERKPGKDLTLTELLRSWHRLRRAALFTDEEDDRFASVLTGWRTAILDILDPPEQIPYMGQACPLCSNTRARVEIAGEVQDTVALWAFLRPEYRDEGSYGLCRACRTVLATDTDPIRLRARMNGAIKSTTHLTKTIAEATDRIGA